MHFASMHDEISMGKTSELADSSDHADLQRTCSLRTCLWNGTLLKGI
jgi:hypothetical protein